MGEQIKRTIVALLYFFVSNVCFAQANYSFFKVEEGIQYSNDMGITWHTATSRVNIKHDALINNPLGKRCALIDNNTEAVYWFDYKGIITIPEIIKSVMRRDKYFLGLFTELASSNDSEPVGFSRRGGIKRGNNNVYIENIVARELTNNPFISLDVKFNIIPVTKHTFYFEVENSTNSTLQFLMLQYDKKMKKWGVLFNYKNADEEIVLTIPSKTKIELKNQEFKNNKSKKYYLVALDEELKLSWQNLLKSLNSNYVGSTFGTTEPSLHVYSNN